MSNNDDINNENPDESNPFGFNLDPEAMSSFINNLMSGAMAPGAGLSALSQGPMNIAERVASNIASKDIENEPIEEPQSNNDPMSEVMSIISMLSTPSTSPESLNIDSLFAGRCEQIYPAAQNYVAEQTQGDDLTTLPLVVTDRVTWTRDYLRGMKGPLETASHSLSPTMGGDTPSETQGMGFDIQSMLSQTIAPMMFGVQAGTMIGYLSHRAYGDDDILLPAMLNTRVGLIGSAVSKFAQDWSVDTDEAILYFLILQTVRAHVRHNGWLSNKLDDLCTQYVGAYELNPYKLDELIGDMNITDPETVTSISVTPEQMFETLRTTTHDILDEEIGRISSLHSAYVEWVTHKNIEILLPNYQIIQEARKRITVTISDADRFVEQLFGVAISPSDRQEAQQFIDGVIERNGEKYLHSMWFDESLFPTENEFNAPGLWLARIEVMEQ